MLNQLSCCVQLNCRIQVHLNFTIFVNHPPTKVPRQLQHFIWILFAYKFLSVSAKVLENLVSVCSINVTLVHNWKANPVFLIYCIFNPCVGFRLLIIELIAGKGNYLESLIFVLLIHLNQSEIIFLSKRSIRGHIHNDGTPFVLYVVSEDSWN